MKTIAPKPESGQGMSKEARNSWRGYSLALLIGWIALGAAACAFAFARHVPLAIALPLALAFLTEYSFYILPGFEGLRPLIRERLAHRGLPSVLTASALLPYLLYAVGTGNFGVGQMWALAVLMGAVAFWYRIPAASTAARRVRDLSFLALLAAVILSGVLRWIYPAPAPKLPLEVLGHITLIRTGILSVLLVRGSPGTDFGFLPRARDFRIGVVWFAACAAIALPLGLAMGQFHMTGAKTHGSWQGVLQSVGVVLGIFWVVALSEEFFFRALLQQWLTDWLRSPALGLALAAVIFGACHLGYPAGEFPDWHFAILAGILGLFYGAAYRQAGSMRAGMVTHTLAVGIWRLFLS